MTEKEIAYESIWLELQELKDMIGLCIKGLDQEPEENRQACSVLSIVERQMTQMLDQLDRNLE